MHSMQLRDLSWEFTHEKLKTYLNSYIQKVVTQ